MRRSVQLFLFSCLILAMSVASAAQRSAKPSSGPSAPYKLTPQDEAFLDDLSRRSFRFFQEQSDPNTGLARDRARTDGSSHGEQQDKIASIASTGFGLTGWLIAAERGWVSKQSAREYVLTTLRFFADRQEH
ncbi:MAG TPA: hypothetical protein VFY40_08750, partial [Blastocatellia bacterium]|nr:hypothetical protein [Blastocatellia bacterium]